MSPSLEGSRARWKVLQSPSLNAQEVLNENLCLPLHFPLGPAKCRTGSGEKPSDLERTADAQTQGSHEQVVEKTGGLRERRKEQASRR